MLQEITLDGVRDKVQIAIDRLKCFEPPEGYYLAFSGGKDSQCIYHLALEGGIKFDAHYNHTTVDPPELIYFMRENYPDVTVDPPVMSMWKLIAEKSFPPIRTRRYCCQALKERGGEGRTCITGVRKAESLNRSKRKPFEVVTKKVSQKMLFNDNDEGRLMFENCTVKGKRVVNPIIDWDDGDVWEYIRSRKLKYCKLYDEGYHRLGCIGCPLAGKRNMLRGFERYPKYRAAYIRAFGRMLQTRATKGLPTKDWETAEDVMEWWIYGNGGRDRR